MVTGDDGGGTCLWRIAQPMNPDAVITLEVLRTWSPLLSTPPTMLNLPSDRAILACCCNKKHIYISRSSERASYTEIWRISITRDSEPHDAIAITNIRHDSYSISCSAICMDFELNPLGRNQLILGTSAGLILKYHLGEIDPRMEEILS